MLNPPKHNSLIAPGNSWNFMGSLVCRFAGVVTKGTNDNSRIYWTYLCLLINGKPTSYYKSVLFAIYISPEEIERVIKGTKVIRL